MTPKSKLIAVEGLDGSGGSTLCAGLCQKLLAKQIPTHLTSEPSSGPIGFLIREILASHSEIPLTVLPYLFAADREDHLQREILPRLAEGGVVITDRYALSSVAYQMLHCSQEHILRMNSKFRIPDLVLMLDLSPEKCVERMNLRDQGSKERFEHLHLLTKIMYNYEDALSWVQTQGSSVLRLKAQLSPETLQNLAFQAVLDLA